ncbi:MAG: 50S ribosomal protein L11 methyltransferase [Proteobacteria bacterium]|nr:50S ribosomal protein L11 methyltransferase [Pseudomonadota bacterium]
MNAPTFLWRIEMRSPADAVDGFEEALEPFCVAISTIAENDADDPDDFWRIEGFTGAEPDEKTITLAINKTARRLGLEPPAPTFELLPAKDWVAENLAGFPPNKIGRYFIHGTHFEGRPPAGLVAIKLDAGAAFGSGEHPTTAACLMMLDRLSKRQKVRRPLDMGCGSGILSLAIAKTWKVAVLACDIDAEAVRVTNQNARLNGVGRLVRAEAGPDYRTPSVMAGGPYDLITANILARPLCHMAASAAKALAPGGAIILSGLLARDAMRVIARHRAHGFRLDHSLALDGWQTLVMKLG